MLERDVQDLALPGEQLEPERNGDLGGLPALPLLSLAFLVANGDILWRHLKQARAGSAPQNA